MVANTRLRMLLALATICMTSCITPRADAWPAWLGGTPTTQSLLVPNKLVNQVQLQIEETTITAKISADSAILNAVIVKFKADDLAARNDLNDQVQTWNHSVEAMTGLIGLATGQPFTLTAIGGALTQILGSISLATNLKRKFKQRTSAAVAATPPAPPISSAG